MIAGPHNWLLGISGTHSRERMERMTPSKRSWFWFLGLYVVSLVLYVAGTLTVRSLVRLAFYFFVLGSFPNSALACR